MARHNIGDVMARAKDADGNDAVVIKKYANRRLYNTATSSYVTLDHLAQMVTRQAKWTTRGQRRARGGGGGGASTKGKGRA